jgi:hypothetical protein
MENEVFAIAGPFTPLVVAALLAVANSEILDYLKRPIVQRFPELDLWWFIYVSFATGLAIGWFAKINLFEDFVDEKILGRILTAALIAGGSTLLYKVFKKPNGE